ncbi:chorion peroxidase [Caerostris darwini]|uniref:Chorion peroxidase n=1 Tax=Caerostris darwini TaxID=1538125 RepID=A0AAV4Q7N5_9ARAC|nr:chorion peroxidase [Caerostris darwini]
MGTINKSGYPYPLAGGMPHLGMFRQYWWQTVCLSWFVLNNVESPIYQPAGLLYISLLDSYISACWTPIYQPAGLLYISLLELLDILLVNVQQFKYLVVTATLLTLGQPVSYSNTRPTPLNPSYSSDCALVVMSEHKRRSDNSLNGIRYFANFIPGSLPGCLLSIQNKYTIVNRNDSGVQQYRTDISPRNTLVAEELGNAFCAWNCTEE